MTIVKWRPINDIFNFSDVMDRFFEDRFVSPSQWSVWEANEVVPIDMYETDRDVMIRASLPGVKPEDVEVTLLGDTLTIKGETKADAEFKDGDCLCRETHYGGFHRELTVPVAVDTDKVEAKFENGILFLTLPKAEESKPKQIKVNVQPALEAQTKGTKKAKK